MKNLLILMFIGVAATFAAQTTKSKMLKIRYTLPAGWNAKEFGNPESKDWEGAGNELCNCSGAAFFKSHKDGKLNVVLYPSTQSGLDSTKRNAVGPLKFEDVVKFDRVRLNEHPFERRKSNFTNTKTNARSFEVFRFSTKKDDRFYIIYAWQENTQSLNSSNENALFEMVKAIELN